MNLSCRYGYRLYIAIFELNFFSLDSDVCALSKLVYSHVLQTNSEPRNIHIAIRLAKTGVVNKIL